ncbi:hypothetical protein [Kitasatospora sp. NPDC056531]|uniref:hypothetical protein n=1 Tax=Kitasatospora sp. NPDC056531 TaxID=3345856 RepID=UPI0036830975
MTKSRVRASITKVSAIGILAAAATISLSPVAFAGQSSTTNGCYSTWGNTGSNAHCVDPHVTVTGNYENYENCSAESDNYSGWNSFDSGAYVNGWGQVDCTWSANYSQVWFSS